MSTIAGHRRQPLAGPRRFDLTAWIESLRLPPQAWSGKRRATLAAAIAAVVFWLGVHGWTAADLGGMRARRAALVDLKTRVGAAQSALGQLPALRAETARVGAVSRALEESPASHWHAITALAANRGVRLHALEPGQAQGEGIEALRPVRFAARASFGSLLAFLQGLPRLSVLVVPADLQVKRDAGALAIDGTLHVFSALPSVAQPGSTAVDADDEESESSADPFAAASLDDFGGTLSLRLAGLLHERGRGLALLETEAGSAALERGQTLGAEQVTRIDARGVTLASRTGIRRLTLQEDRP